MRSSVCRVAGLLAAGIALVPGAGCRREASPRLVLLLTVDTLRADHLGAYGSRAGLTPVLDRLARESLVFERAYTPVPFTLAAMAAAMTSLYPEEIGVVRNRSMVPKGPVTLAGWLGARGWRTGAVVSNFVLRPESGIARGFARFDAELPQREKARGLAERTAAGTTDAALAMLDALLREGSGRVFLWVHYQDPHGPYTPPDPPGHARFEAFAGWASDSGRELALNRDDSGQGGLPRYQDLDGRRDPAFYRASYMGEVAHTDAMIGRLLAGLAGRGLEGRSALIFTADHGEGLGESDYWFAHGEQLSEPLVHVPLLVRAPGVGAGRRADVVSLLDLYPTVAAMAGGEAPAGTRGRDLLGPGPGDATVFVTNMDRGRTRRRGLIEDGFKYLRHKMDTEHRARETLTALGTDAPDLAEARAEVLAAARDRYSVARRAIRTMRAQGQKLSPEDQERLRALGYVGNP